MALFKTKNKKLNIGNKSCKAPIKTTTEKLLTKI